MKAKEIQELISFIAKSGLEEVNIETDEIKLHIKRNPELSGASVVAAAPRVVEQPIMVQAPAVQQVIKQAEYEAPAPVAAAPVAAPPAAPVANESRYVTIKSPMIGTFYRSANPNSPALVEVGDKVGTGKVVCIIEAMKLFNEIESEISGTIVKVLVENASPVEYDQPLFLVDPA